MFSFNFFDFSLLIFFLRSAEAAEAANKADARAEEAKAEAQRVADFAKLEAGATGIYRCIN